jgi:isopentenyl phosphate kinase
MDRMRLQLLELWDEVGFRPAALQPSAIALASDGSLSSLDLTVIERLLSEGQVPLVHGDIVLDRQRGFTIASTESQFRLIASQLPVERVVMVTDVPGVLDHRGEVIPLITPETVSSHPLEGAAATDVTGGMRHKVESLFALLREAPRATVRVVSGLSDSGMLSEVLLGRSTPGTLISL